MPQNFMHSFIVTPQMQVQVILFTHNSVLAPSWKESSESSRAAIGRDDALPLEEDVEMRGNCLSSCLLDDLLGELGLLFALLLLTELRPVGDLESLWPLPERLADAFLLLASMAIMVSSESLRVSLALDPALVSRSLPGSLAAIVAIPSDD